MLTGEIFLQSLKLLVDRLGFCFLLMDWLELQEYTQQSREVHLVKEYALLEVVFLDIFFSNVNR